MLSLLLTLNKFFLLGLMFIDKNLFKFDSKGNRMLGILIVDTEKVFTH